MPTPTRPVVVVRPGRAEAVEVLHVLLDRVRDPIEELALVHGAVRPALTARAVVGDEDDDRVLELTRLLEEVEQPSNLMVGVREEAGKDLGHAAEEPLLVVRERVPRADDVERVPGLSVEALLLRIGIERGELGVRGEDASLLLSLEDEVAIRLVAHVEAALVLLDPLLRDVMWRVASAGTEVHEERLVRSDHLGVRYELDRLVR